VESDRRSASSGGDVEANNDSEVYDS
jgi:hypothetical protein